MLQAMKKPHILDEVELVNEVLEGKAAWHKQISKSLHVLIHVAKASKVLAIDSPCIKRYRFSIRYEFEDPNDFWEHAQNEKKLPESQTDSSDFICLWGSFIWNTCKIRITWKSFPS